MSKADELRVLRDRVVAAVKAVPPWEDQRQRNPALVHNDCIASVYEAFAAYLNEKPQEPPLYPNLEQPDTRRDAPPPNAAAEPEKPMDKEAQILSLANAYAGAWAGVTDASKLAGGFSGAMRVALERFASPSAQPIASEDLLENAYWEFDARKKGYAAWKELPQSERDAFKSAVESPGASPVASPAQPIARDEQDAKRYRWLRERIDDNGCGKARLTADIHIDFYNLGMSLDEAIDYHLKSAGKE